MMCLIFGNMLKKTNIYRTGHNCWDTGVAEKATLLIDCASYYRVLYHALCRAKKSIFVLGWDIDGRIELLRGKEAENKEIPVGFADLIRWKAKHNPDLKVYLNRWNYSIFFSRERESFSGWKWRMHTPSNVYYCADYKIPFGACHHQKIIVIDDEIAFCGGMDIALGRWDRRSHHIEVENRVDPGGIFQFFRKHPYEPYHDIQCVMTGPIVEGLARLARERWEKGAGFKAIPIEEKQEKSRHSDIWPNFITPDFEQIEVGITRTLPAADGEEAVQEILHMYLDEISQAEKFIYIENQYLTCPEIGKALNEQLKKKPELRVLAVSCDHPRGFMEHKAMWTGRVKLYDLVRDGIDESRFAVAYPICTENDVQKTIHIHSKVMIVDDRFLHVGSANLNNRSMGFDTECDITIEGENIETRSRIASIRNNLIREHTGRTEENIAELIQKSDLEGVLEYQENSRQHLKKIDNSPYRGEFLSALARKIGDPKKPYLDIRFPVRQVLYTCLILGVLGVLSWLYIRPVLPDEFRSLFTQESLTGFIEAARGSIWSPFIIMGVYVLAGAFFFSVMALNLATAIVFGPVYGFLYACLGSLSSAAVGYGVGRLAGWKMAGWFKSALEKIRSYSEKGGVIGMTMVRMVPIAPFTVVNLAFGMAHTAFLAYIFSTFLGLLPGITAKALFGGALGELFANPEPKVIFYTAGTLVLWGGIIWGTHLLFKYYKQKEGT